MGERPPVMMRAYSVTLQRHDMCPLLARYAQRSKEARIEWSSFTKEYFLKRETLANVLLLVDSSVPVQVPHECAAWDVTVSR